MGVTKSLSGNLKDSAGQSQNSVRAAGVRAAGSVRDVAGGVRDVAGGAIKVAAAVGSMVAADALGAADGVTDNKASIAIKATADGAKDLTVTAVSNIKDNTAILGALNEGVGKLTTYY